MALNYVTAGKETEVAKSAPGRTCRMQLQRAPQSWVPTRRRLQQVWGSRAGELICAVLDAVERMYFAVQPSDA